MGIGGYHLALILGLQWLLCCPSSRRVQHGFTPRDLLEVSVRVAWWSHSLDLADIKFSPANGRSRWVA